MDKTMVLCTENYGTSIYEEKKHGRKKTKIKESLIFNGKNYENIPL